MELCIIDGFGPLPVVRPASTPELGDEVRRAASEGRAIYPTGGQTQLDLGNPPTKPGNVVDLRGLNQIIDFPARDMTVTVQAGITVAEWQALVAPETLRLPIDVPQSGRATLGGILAANVSGPRRYGYGTLRDYVIGISAVNDDGNEFKAGGRVVKNVAGYDLCKLLIGSLGTLGIITQATLKLRPLAEETALVSVGCDTASVGDLLGRLHQTRTRPVCLELIRRQEGQPGAAAWSAVVGYEGNSDAVNWQVQQLVKELGTAFSLDALLGACAQARWRDLMNSYAPVDRSLRLKATMPASSMPAFAMLVAEKTPEIAVQMHAGNGIAWGHDSPANDEAGLARAARTVKEWRDFAVQQSGSVVVQRCPHAWKATLDVWGPAPGDIALMRKVKNQMDPKMIFNPGRFVSGM